MLAQPLSRRPFSERLGVLVALLVAGCSPSAGGPEYLDISVSALEDGSAAPTGRCTPIPVMPGGRTTNEISFVSAFSAKVDASRDRVSVTFHGLVRPELIDTVLTSAELDGGYADTDIRVETPGGRRFSVNIVVPCPSSTGEP